MPEHQQKPILVFKYGGNAMLNAGLQRKVLSHLCDLKEKGFHIVLVHGGGPFIKENLDRANIHSEFVDGHRKTTSEALTFVEMALKGQVNSQIVGLLNSLGQKAIGLSGKDGRMVEAVKRYHEVYNDEGIITQHDLGQVGDVKSVDTQLLTHLLEEGYFPVMTCLAQDAMGETYNINGDIFAGHIAGALDARAFIVLTDIDGLLLDINDPDSLIKQIETHRIDEFIQKGIIKGGMIPKMEACSLAIMRGAQSARIINGTEPNQILTLTSDGAAAGTLITKS